MQRQSPTLSLGERASAQHIESKRVALRSLLLMRNRVKIIAATLLLLMPALVAIFPDEAHIGVNWAMQHLKADQHITMSAPDRKPSVPQRESTGTAQPKPQRVRPATTHKSHNQEQEASTARHANPNHAAADIF